MSAELPVPRGRSGWTAVVAVLGELRNMIVEGLRENRDELRRIQADQRKIEATLAEMREQHRQHHQPPTT